MNKVGILSQADELRLVSAWRIGKDAGARDQLVAAYGPYIEWVASAGHPAGYERRRDQGIDGLFEALDTYQPKFGLSFRFWVDRVVQKHNEQARPPQLTKAEWTSIRALHALLIKGQSLEEALEELTRQERIHSSGQRQLLLQAYWAISTMSLDDSGVNGQAVADRLAAPGAYNAIEDKVVLNGAIARLTFAERETVRLFLEREIGGPNMDTIMNRFYVQATSRVA